MRGQLREMRLGLLRGILAVLVIAVNKLVAMDAIKGKNHHHDEVGNQQRRCQKGSSDTDARKSDPRNASGNSAADRAAEKSARRRPHAPTRRAATGKSLKLISNHCQQGAASARIQIVR